MIDIACVAAVAIMVCLGCMLFAVVYDRARSLFRNSRIPPAIRPMVGMVAAGLAGLGMAAMAGIDNPEFFLGPSSDLYSGKALASLSANSALAGLGLILLGRILTTSLTVGSGGSGGLLWPTILVGLLASLVGMRLLGQNAIPLYAAVGVAVALTVLIDVPIAAIILVVEVMGGICVLPAIIGVLVGRIFGRSVIGWMRVVLLEQLQSKEAGEAAANL